MTTDNPDIIVPDWPVPGHIKAFTTTRSGGYSLPPYDSFNLALHTNDDEKTVLKNREKLQKTFHLPSAPVWMNQVHSNTVILLDASVSAITADASYTQQKGVVCAVLTADCLPVFITDKEGSVVAIAHAGWKGLAAGIITETIQSLNVKAENLLVWLGPAIGPQTFEVQRDVYDAFIQNSIENKSAFQSVFKDQSKQEYWLCDVYQLAKIELASLGVEQVFGGGRCTFTEADKFYSYRRDGVNSGRNAHLIWIDDPK